MLEALIHRLVLQVAHADALEHDSPIQPASRGTPGIPGRALVAGMFYRIVVRAERKIITPQLWTLLEW